MVRNIFTGTRRKGLPLEVSSRYERPWRFLQKRWMMSRLTKATRYTWLPTERPTPLFHKNVLFPPPIIPDSKPALEHNGIQNGTYQKKQNCVQRVSRVMMHARMMSSFPHYTFPDICLTCEFSRDFFMECTLLHCTSSLRYISTLRSQSYSMFPVLPWHALVIVLLL